MSYFCERSRPFWALPFLLFLGGCGAKPECDSFETRNAVLQIVSDDHNNPLVNYAAGNSTANSNSGDTGSDHIAKSLDPEKIRPMYLLGEKIVTTATSEGKRTLKCSGLISVTVGDTTASKEVNFTVQQSPDGKISVSVAPFEF